ncbi:MAG: methyltransferase, TrmH family [Acidimicrobiaceae bacterium]|nr:methyltransferase, TrmH family [Acidimicrobiaceae bacterium]
MTPLTYKHQRVQRLRRLASRRSARLAERCFVVEGVKVLREALAAGVDIDSVYIDRTDPISDGALDDLLHEAYAAGNRVFDLAPGVLARVADTATPQPVMAVVRQMDVALTELRTSTKPELVVVCVDLRDPGNAGTVLRSAEAAGATGVVCCDGSVDLFNPKTVRASAGALFRVPVVAGGDPSEVLAELGSWGLARLATTPRGGEDYTDADLTRPIAIIIGNEAHGLPSGLDSLLDGQLTVPMAGQAESLNAGMAAAVLCFEAARQRRQGRESREARQRQAGQETTQDQPGRIAHSQPNPEARPADLAAQPAQLAAQLPAQPIAAAAGGH